MVSGFTLEKLGLHVVPPYWFIICLRHRIRKLNIRINRPHVIDRYGLIFFHSGERIKKYSAGFAAEFAGYVWTEAVSGMKKDAD